MSLEKRFPVKEKGKVSKKVYLCIILKMCLRMIFFTFGTFGIFTGTYTIVRETITGSK